MDFLKLLLTISLLCVLAFAAKTYLIPVLPKLDYDSIVSTPFIDLMKLLEFIGVFFLLAALVLDEIIGIAKSLIYSHNHSGAKWSNFFYVFLTIFASGFLYIAFVIFTKNTLLQ